MASMVMSALLSKKRKSGEHDPLPSLLELCITSLRHNIDSIGSVDNIAPELLVRILQSASPEQLSRIEDATQDRLRCLEKLWRGHCTRLIMASPEAMEADCKKAGGSWKKLYYKRIREAEEKRRSVGEKMRAMYSGQVQEKESKKVVVLDRVPMSAAKQVNKLPRASSSSSFSYSSRPLPTLGERKAGASSSSSSSSGLSKLAKLKKEANKERLISRAPLPITPPSKKKPPSLSGIKPGQEVRIGVGVMTAPKDIRPGMQTQFAPSKKSRY
eukprot:TRINITY_DN2297_c1_g2_i1.p1 TRINITY_DN2297_c1_g2~~TRINITY_DN2297_c1_g2_i1.p1  ORF type:complete len:279 (-),score=37.57 TRINITY_DN2297_c1_g2_i1:77-889(-)